MLSTIEEKSHLQPGAAAQQQHIVGQPVQSLRRGRAKLGQRPARVEIAARVESAGENDPVRLGAAQRVPLAGGINKPCIAAVKADGGAHIADDHGLPKTAISEQIGAHRANMAPPFGEFAVQDARHHAQNRGRPTKGIRVRHKQVGDLRAVARRIGLVKLAPRLLRRILRMLRRNRGSWKRRLRVCQRTTERIQSDEAQPHRDGPAPLRCAREPVTGQNGEIKKGAEHRIPFQFAPTKGLGYLVRGKRLGWSRICSTPTAAIAHVGRK